MACIVAVDEENVHSDSTSLTGQATGNNVCVRDLYTCTQPVYLTTYKVVVMATLMHRFYSEG